MNVCPCGTGRSYEECCGPYLTRTLPAPTPETLMRSRYTAYVRADIDYLRETLIPEGRESFDEEACRRWATQSQWLGLHISSASGDDLTGSVTFTARYVLDGEEREHQEVATFRRDPAAGVWLFESGRKPKNKTLERASTAGRNDPCPCGSGKKYKKCCGA